MVAETFDAARALAPLKAFQRRTVDYVFDRLYGSVDSIRQFLVADEVGLGKTMVARGLIARTIEHLWKRTGRIDILYICSNQAIAAQNINRLNVLGRKDLALPTRMTLIPLQLQGQNGLDANRVNFISLTPGTTFDLRSATGVTRERALIRHLLHDLVTHPRGLHNLLQVSAGPDNWNNAVQNMSLDAIDKPIIERFRRDVQSDVTLFQELERVAELFPRRRESYPLELTQPRSILVARLRAKLSHACVDALQPDLIILDEFQRFRDLLHGDNDAAILARELFDYRDSDGNAARTLLLSATPYRMLTLSGDVLEEGDHYADFLETLKFLYGRGKGAEVAESLAKEMRGFREFLRALPASHGAAVQARHGIEQTLRRVMSRTERVESTVDRDCMVSEPAVRVTVAPVDLAQAAAVAGVARALDAPEIIEYWKSAPYLLNFMRHGQYVLKRKLEEQLAKPDAALLSALREARPAMLNREAIDTYQPVEPGNGRMRALMEEVFDGGLEKHLWLPPSLPYYGPVRSGTPPTKALIFSSWSMVPDAIAALVSYEAERRMGVGQSGSRYFETHRVRPLQFRKDDGRLTSLRTLLLIYPSPTLARLADPLAIFTEHSSQLSLEGMRAAVATKLHSTLQTLQGVVADPTASTVPEWAAPVLLDRLMGMRSSEWLSAADGLKGLAAEEAYHEHVSELAGTAEKRTFSGLPENLAELLVDVALGSPATCALRALKRVAPELAWDDPQLLRSAAQVAWAFRTLYNQHDAVALLRQGGEEIYWHRVLTYGTAQNLQAVLDEYAHCLVDAEGLGAKPPEDRAKGVAAAMAKALSIRPSQIEVDDPTVNESQMTVGKFTLRGRLAMRLADYKDEEGAVARLGGVRDAFNSPFKPFVLATTSVGQEGLDFHHYCYRVYHWNLPSNPVDLEQREGRVHRFKGHAVRLNIAEKQIATVRGTSQVPDDPWQRMFERARAEALVDTDLIPYWIYEGSVRVERRVPMLPFSREQSRLDWLKRSLTVYRLAFGQPRQEDLLNYLQTLVGSGMNTESLTELQIRLDPRPLESHSGGDKPFSAGSDAPP